MSLPCFSCEPGWRPALLSEGGDSPGHGRWPVSALMSLFSESFFLYFFPFLFLSARVDSVSATKKFSENLLVSHAVHGQDGFPWSFLAKRISIPSFCQDGRLNPWVTHLKSFANSYPTRPLALFPKCATCIGSNHYLIPKQLLHF